MSKFEKSKQLNESFIESIKNNDIEKCKYILRSGQIDINCETNKAAKLVVELGHTDILKLFLSSTPIILTSNENNLLWLASIKGHYDIVKLLLEDKNVVNEISGSYSIRHAFRANYFNIVEILWELDIMKKFLINEDEELYRILQKRFIRKKVVNF
jgi:ankyrin repeat protein